jgi:hypothetical protein
MKVERHGIFSGNLFFVFSRGRSRSRAFCEDSTTPAFLIMRGEVFQLLLDCSSVVSQK